MTLEHKIEIAGKNFSEDFWKKKEKVFEKIIKEAYTEGFREGVYTALNKQKPEDKKDMDETSADDMELLNPDTRKALEYKLNDIAKNVNVRSAEFKYADFGRQLALVVVTDNKGVQHHTAYSFGSLNFEYDMFAAKEKE